MTSQVSDTLAIRGRQVLADEFIPLGDHPALVEVTYEEARRDFDFVGTTACWRNYRAHWRLTDERFDLLHVDGGFRITEARPLQASWLTGRLVLPLEDVHTFSNRWREAPYVERLWVTLNKGAVESVDVVDWNEAVPLWEPFDKSFERRRVSWGIG